MQLNWGKTKTRYQSAWAAQQRHKLPTTNQVDDIFRFPLFLNSRDVLCLHTCSIQFLLTKIKEKKKSSKTSQDTHVNLVPIFPLTFNVAMPQKSHSLYHFRESGTNFIYWYAMLLLFRMFYIFHFRWSSSSTFDITLNRLHIALTQTWPPHTHWA